VHRTCLVEAGKVRSGVGAASCGHNQDILFAMAGHPAPAGGSGSRQRDFLDDDGPLSGFSSLACETPERDHVYRFRPQKTCRTRPRSTCSIHAQSHHPGFGSGAHCRRGGRAGKVPAQAHCLAAVPKDALVDRTPPRTTGTVTERWCSTARRSCQRMNDIAARRNGRCPGDCQGCSADSLFASNGGESVLTVVGGSDVRSDYRPSA